MKKKIITFMLAAAVVLSVCGCTDKEPERIDLVDFDFSTEVTTVRETESAEEACEEKGDLEQTEFSYEEDSSETAADSGDIKEEAAEFSLAELKRYKFWFLSGAGGWATTLHINEDGSFSGEYSDSDMGAGGEAYPYGTIYQCSFSGKFTQPVRVNEYTYSMQISEIDYAEEVGTEEIKDGVKYCYTDVYGLDDAKDILIYLPGSPLAELPEEFRMWVGYYNLSDTEDTELPFYALNNEAQQQGFSGHDMVSEFQEDVAYRESWAADLEQSIENDSLTTAEYNEKTRDLFELWDYALNELWEILQYTQDAETMAVLTAEEREWISWKEQEIEKAGAENEGGSIQVMIKNMKAAELTKARVYELMKQFLNSIGG